MEIIRWLELSLWQLSKSGLLSLYVCFRFDLGENLQPFFDPPKSKCYDGQRWISETGRFYSEYTTLSAISFGIQHKPCTIIPDHLPILNCAFFSFQFHGGISIIASKGKLSQPPKSPAYLLPLFQCTHDFPFLLKGMIVSGQMIRNHCSSLYLRIYWEIWHMVTTTSVVQKHSRGKWQKRSSAQLSTQLWQEVLAVKDC